MKRLIISLIILVLAGAAIFFLGWIQILIPPGTYAVIHTKTGGYDKDVLPSGEFSWRIERLLPTNMRLYKFTLEPVEIDIPLIEGVLPSGNIYASVMEKAPDFSFEILLSVSFTLIPDALPRLVEYESLTPDNLSQWYREIGYSIGRHISEMIKQDPAQLNQPGYQDNLLSRLSKMTEFSHLEITQIKPINVQIPDMELYSEAKRIYFNISSAREAKDLLAIEEEETNLKMLREYAKLLTEYPVLIQYLYLKELKGEGMEILNMEFPDPR